MKDSTRSAKNEGIFGGYFFGHDTHHAEYVREQQTTYMCIGGMVLLLAFGKQKQRAHDNVHIETNILYYFMENHAHWRRRCVREWKNFRPPKIHAYTYNYMMAHVYIVIPDLAWEN